MPSFAGAVYGLPDCGQWIKETPINKEQNKWWLLGFLSGLNVDERVGDSLAKTTSTKQIFLWMDNYCMNNPLKNVGEGAQVLMVELMKK